ncbi:MAG: hypothetical protein LBD02_00885 [Christensenellaceae bacterium]|jgi:hypothetical protein|nr:hypothetical protein [Christensenellaceae bacterium]
MMRWSDEITLIGIVPPAEDDETTNENGFTLSPEETQTTVYCNKKSVGYSEFYKAQQAGYSTELKFDMYTEEYSGQEYAEYSGKRYKILRTYVSKSGEFTELTLSDLSERGGAVDG